MVPENIRYGVTITPPDGDPVTGMANLEPPLDNFVVAGTCATNKLNTYPNSYDDSTSATWTINLEANTCYEMVVQFYGMTFRYTDGSGSHSIPYSGEGSSSGGKPASSHYAHAKTGADGRIIIQKGSVDDYFSVMIFKANNVLTASNIKAGVTIGGVEGTANEMPNSFATFSNWMYYSGNESGARGSYCWDKTNATSYAQGTASNYTYTAAYPQSNVIVFANTLQDEENPYPASITADSGTLSENNGGYGYLVGDVTGHVLKFDPPSSGNTSCFAFVYSRPAPGYENLKPENIRAGVTITPPGGVPVTGQCMPCDSSIGKNIIGFIEASGRYTINGDTPDGVGLGVKGTTGFEITGSGTITGYVVSRGGTISFSGDYDGSGISETLAFGYIPPTTLSRGINVSFGSTTLRSVIVCLIKIDNNNLVASNIKAGITINGITGTMIGGELTAKLITTANSGGLQFRTSLGQTSATNNTDKPVNPLPDGSKLTILASNNGFSDFNATINGSGETIDGNSSFDEIITSMSIAGFTNKDNYTVGAIGLFYK